MTKIIARYLPQFHRIPENDLWWGNGFTEWTAVKAGESLFCGHNQPRVPLNDNYYNLLIKDNMLWQAELANKYSIDGFAFYHYWFKGKQVLEKPAENLLKWQDIDMPFMFSWANETWARTWSKMSGVNGWARKFEPNMENEKSSILLEQKYGMHSDWKEHIEYLIPFFKDERYIKNHGKPVFMIYKPEQIYCLPDMLDYWNSILNANDIPGLYVIGELSTLDTPICDVVDASVYRMPNCCMNEFIKYDNNEVKHVKYSDYWEYILQNKKNLFRSKNSYICAFVDYDDTPRRGSEGIVFDDVRVEKFDSYFRQLYDFVCSKGDEYLFINAWNEWGEGMYLEPDTYKGYGYLESIHNTVMRYSGVNEEEKEVSCNTQYKKLLIGEQMLKTLSYYRNGVRSLNMMMDFKEKGISIADCLKKYGYSNVAIYGYGYLGKYLYECLKQSCVKVSYVIDKNSNVKCLDLPVFQLSHDLPEVDTIIVTPAGKYASIRADIHNIVKYDTISLEHILYDLM